MRQFFESKSNKMKIADWPEFGQKMLRGFTLINKKQNRLIRREQKSASLQIPSSRELADRDVAESEGDGSGKRVDVLGVKLLESVQMYEIVLMVGQFQKVLYVDADDVCGGEGIAMRELQKYNISRDTLENILSRMV